MVYGVLYGVTLMSVYFLKGEKSSTPQLQIYQISFDLFSIRKNIRERDVQKYDEQEKTGRT